MFRIIHLNVASIFIIILFSMVIGFNIKLLYDALSSSSDSLPFMLSILVVFSMMVVIIRGNMRKYRDMDK